MAPHSTQLVKEDTITEKKTDHRYKLEIKWTNTIIIILLHIFAPYGLYILMFKAYYKTFFINYLVGTLSGIGVTGGAHRLWCHRSYKARLPMRIIMAALHTMAAETDLYVWCRDHRVHHKYAETDADPHNIKRGFFFAHCGWLMCKKHPEVTEKGKTVYLDDLMADPVVRYQRKFHIPLSILFSFYLPIMIPVWFWNESLHFSIFGSIFRYVLLLNVTWSVNSFAHLLGDRPFDQSIAASEHPVVAFCASGEGWHNFHHVFPWDYAASELGYKFNLTKIFIDMFACVGQAYDLKQANPREIARKKLQNGDGTRIKDIDNGITNGHCGNKLD